MKEHRIDYYNPSDEQLAAATFATYVATACIRRSTLWHLDSRDIAVEQIHPGILDEMRRSDTEEQVFTIDLSYKSTSSSQPESNGS